jgi:hypothetical protein
LLALNNEKRFLKEERRLVSVVVVAIFSVGDTDGIIAPMVFERWLLIQVDVAQVFRKRLDC